MPGRRKGATSLRMGIDNDVYTIAIRLLENPSLEATVPSLWQAIQRSNSSLKRKPKKMIEDSLERVLESLAEDGEDEEAGLEAQHTKSLPSEDINIMNKSLTGAWKTAMPPHNSPVPGTPRNDEGTPALTNGTRSETGQRRKRRREESQEKPRPEPPTVRFSDLGGIGKVVKQLKELVLIPLKMPQVYSKFNLPIPRGILLHGPPGCGKSQLAKATAAEAGVPLIEILGPSVVSGMSGESEKQIREVFEDARKQAPCILFIDEIDVLAPKRESSQSQMEKRIVAQLLISMDTLENENSEDEERKPVIVFAATNRPDTLDPALRRGGRFATEINMGVPNERTRAGILKALTRNMSLAPDVDFAQLARMTAGFVGADIHDLIGKAGSHAMRQFVAALEAQVAASASELQSGGMDVDAIDGQHVLHDSEADEDAAEIESWRLLCTRADNTDLQHPAGYDNISIPMASFLAVLPGIVPSGKREGFATIPDTTWENIGALKNVREELQVSIVNAIKHREQYARLGLSAPAGVLLWGPPGCGKTLLAKAVANESKANFISIKGPELLNKFVGESERAVRTVFQRAQSSVPCVIFFDELDALVPRRDEAGSEASARVVNTLLTEMDGLGGSREGIFVIAATNRPDVVDDAMLRPGRLETLLYVGLPGPSERAEILLTLLRAQRAAGKRAGGKTASSSEALADSRGGARQEEPSQEGGNDAALMALARDDTKCGGLSGADLNAVVRKAGFITLRRGGSSPSVADFEEACRQVRPSVGDLDRFEKLKKRFGVV